MSMFAKPTDKTYREPKPDRDFSWIAWFVVIVIIVALAFSLVSAVTRQAQEFKSNFQSVQGVVQDVKMQYVRGTLQDFYVLNFSIGDGKAYHWLYADQTIKKGAAVQFTVDLRDNTISDLVVDVDDPKFIDKRVDSRTHFLFENELETTEQ